MNKLFPIVLALLFFFALGWIIWDKCKTLVEMRDDTYWDKNN